jgi:AcrR family transcriptional regulator
VQAAGRVVSERGLQGVRIRQIATSAGLSPAAVLYHYADTAELMVAVHQEAVDRYIDERRTAQAQFTDARQRLATAVGIGVPRDPADETRGLLFEMHSLARRSDAHTSLMSRLWDQELALYEEILVAGRKQKVFKFSSRPENVAATLLALDDGLALHLISNNASVDTPRALSLFFSLAARELGCPSLVDFAKGEPVA